MKFDRKAACDKLRLMVTDYAIRIAPVYQSLRWTWNTGPDKHVPTTEQIRDKLLRDIDRFEKSSDCIRSRGGGLEIGITDDDGHPFIEFSDSEIAYDVQTVAYEDQPKDDDDAMEHRAQKKAVSE